MVDQSLPASAAPASAAQLGGPAKPASKARPRLIAAGVASVVAAAAVLYWAHARRFEVTDDAQIDGTIANVGPRVAGSVVAVSVAENQTVKAGEVLFEIDPTDLRIAVDQAKAQVSQARAQLDAEDPSVPITVTSNQSALSTARSDLTAAGAGLAAARKDVEQLTAQLVQAMANDRTAQLEKDRAGKLIAQGAISQADFDQRNNGATASGASVQAIEQSLAAARDHVAQQQAQIGALNSRYGEIESNAPRQVATRRATVLVRQAALDLAKAQLAEAEQNLSYAKVTAPMSGIVAKKSVAMGDHVAPGQSVIAISQTDSLYVTANFRETQLERMQPGEAAVVHIDALDLDLRGAVESIGGATGSRLSVFPPENATGNYVKVVQRIPVRVRFEAGQPGLERLRIGMSAEPQVSVR